MTTEGRTPDMREVRAMYDAGCNLYRETPEQHYLGHPAPDYGAEFDRALAAHDARVARDALTAAEHRIARLEAQTDIRGRAVVMYRERARVAEAKVSEQKVLRMKAVAAVTEAEAERDEWRQTAPDGPAGEHPGTDLPTLADAIKALGR